MKKIAVIHYMPLEFYPPVTNFLDIFALYKNNQVKVFSTHNNKGRKVYSNPGIERIYRSSLPSLKDSSPVRILKYVVFNLSCFFKLLRFQPNSILYYESYSAWPVYWYLRLFGSRTNLFIHYHEYSPPEWYEKGMRLVKLYHNYEKKLLYQKAGWISHTNQQRLDLFLKDMPKVDPIKMRVLPNYPPKFWSKSKKETESESVNRPIKSVYVGSLSLEDTYLEAYCQWVIDQKGKVTFDIYAYNLHLDTERYLQSLSSNYINFFAGGVEYSELPNLLINYDVGLILYKALTKNYQCNAPNKLWEYLICGLQVWYSDTMLGIHRYSTDDVIPVNFKNIHQLNLKNPTLHKRGINYGEKVAENALKPLISELTT